MKQVLAIFLLALFSCNTNPVSDKVVHASHNLVIASAILRPDGNATPDGKITWSILDPSTGHNSEYFSSVSAEGDNLVLNFPKVKNVVNVIVSTDETLASYGVTCGASVGSRDAKISAFSAYGSGQKGPNAYRQLSLNVNDSTGFPGNTILSQYSNFWVLGVFQVGN